MNHVSIWKDNILLKWDGVVPSEAPEGSVHCPEDVVHFWSYLKGFVRWNNKLHCFMLNLSKQNLKRIKYQFGEIPVKLGMDAIRDIKEKQAAFYDMQQLALNIKNLPIEQLPQYNYKVKPLGDYQHRGVVLCSNIRRFPLFAECGLGKSYMVINSIKRHMEVGVVPSGKTLVCAKLTTIETGWLEDTEKFSDLKCVSVWLPPSTYRRKEKLIALLNTPADFYVINHDGVMVLEKELAEKQFQKVVVDESTILKGFHGMYGGIKGGQFGRALNNISSYAEWRVIMSGTPSPNGPHDLWGQFYFLDPHGLLLEASYSDFKAEFMQTIDLRPKGKRAFGPKGRDPVKYIPKPDTFSRVNDLITPTVYRLKIRDHLLDLPEITIIQRRVDMDKVQTNHYREMVEKLMTVLDDTRITVPVLLAKLMKLRQITGGFIIDNQEVAHALPVNPKLKELDSLLEDEIAPDSKVVIYAQFRWEIELIQSRYKDTVAVYGGNSQEENLSNIKRFREDPNILRIVLHPKSAAHGITFTVSHYMIFYSIDHSSESDSQCVARIERAGQKNAMFVYYLLCRESTDVDCYNVRRIKQDNQSKTIDQQFLEETWKRLKSSAMPFMADKMSTDEVGPQHALEKMAGP